MRITRLRLENWRNFRKIDLPLRRRTFLVGPNASGKSNLLDAFRFLRDLAEPQGGFQSAVAARDGVSQIRCLHARENPAVLLDVEIDLSERGTWRYLLEFGQDKQRRPTLRREQAWKDGLVLLERPDALDRADPNRLTQTHLEQVNANKEFREVADFFTQIRYLHLVPQLIRDAERRSKPDDPFGTDFLERVATASAKTRESRLRRINAALRLAVPQLAELKLERDVRGIPHLRGRYEHWRPNAGWQSEEQFSDGTLRLLGLLWALLDGSAPLLLEEPELSLHAAIVRQIPRMMNQAGGRNRRQIFVSTHSGELLSDSSIAPEEVVILKPSAQGTTASLAGDSAEIRALLEGGLTVAEAVLPMTEPPAVAQLALFGD